MKPPLLLRDLYVGRTFQLSFPVSSQLVEDYCQAVGDHNPLYRSEAAAQAAGYPRCVAPPGLAGIFGRQAYLGEYSMPPGGVLAGQTIELHAPGFVGEEFAVNCLVKSMEEKKGRYHVTLESVARRPSGEAVATVRVVVMWPPDPAAPPTPSPRRGGK